jgi:hypothetical protein
MTAANKGKAANGEPMVQRLISPWRVPDALRLASRRYQGGDARVASDSALNVVGVTGAGT